MKKKVQHLEQLFDYAASRLTVYKGADGRLMVTEVLGQGGVGRIYSIETLFKYAEQAHKNYQEESFINHMDQKYRKEFRDIEEKLKNIAKAIDYHRELHDRTPRFGWK